MALENRARTIPVDWPGRSPGIEGEVHCELMREVGRNRSQPSDAGELKNNRIEN
jgi:hypothetical protein